MHRTAFYSFHVEHGAKMVDFAGWEMPILYRSIHEEHQHVRASGGLFDVSHMGRFKISGRHARRLLEKVLTRRVSDMNPNTCRYSLVCNEQGGVKDDVIVYRFDSHWLLVVNASNREKILEHIRGHLADLVVEIEDQTFSTSMVALQGPKVMDFIGRFSSEVPKLNRYSFCTKNFLILKMIFSRTGYTGEDGVEVILPSGMVGMAIKLLMNNQGTSGEGSSGLLAPVGLGARDTLRMEAGMPLYGHELDEGIDAISAGLGFAVNLDKDQHENGEKFIGQEALQRIAAEGPKQKRVGLKLEGRRTARQGMKIFSGDQEAGFVTSGCLSPSLGYPIAMGYLDAERSTVGGLVDVDTGTSRLAATIVGLPFYKKP